MLYMRDTLFEVFGLTMEFGLLKQLFLFMLMKDKDKDKDKDIFIGPQEFVVHMTI